MATTEAENPQQMNIPYETLDAVGLAELVRRREISVAELLEEAIARTEAGNEKLNAVVNKLYDEARLAADQTLPDSPLAGVPFLVKDITDLKGTATSLGSHFFAGNSLSLQDAHLIRRFKSAGLIIYGKTSTPELGLAATTEPALFGPCRNPWNTDYTPGGSSGGSAAAVAAGWVPAAHATDGGGSIRIPASCCHLVGLKPSRARTSSGPAVGEGWGGMAGGNVVTRSVRDSAAFLDVAHGFEPEDPYCAPTFTGNYLQDHQTDPGRLKIAIDTMPLTGAVPHSECQQAVEETAEYLKGIGHEVSVEAPDYDRKLFGEATHTLVAANVANTIDQRARHIGRTPNAGELEPVTLEALNFGRSLSAAAYVNALAELHNTRRILSAFMGRYDLILSPTLVAPPVPIGWLDPTNDDVQTYNERFRLFWGFTSLYNGTGQPAISPPMHKTPDALPVGVQLAAAYGNELLLLQVARQLEEAVSGFNRVAP